MSQPELRIHCKFDELVDVALLVPHPKNRNNHPKAQIQRLAEVLQYQGWRYAIKVSKRTGYVISGHGRLSAAKEMGMEAVPVVFQDYESEEQEYADLTADNAVALWAELDFSGINTDIIDLGPDFNIDMLGIQDFVLEPADKEGKCDEDDVPNPPAIATTKPGDLYLLGNHRLLCGDSTDHGQVSRLMKGEKATLWCSDPPYGINHVDTSQEKGQSKGYSKIKNDDLHDEELQKFIFEVISASLPHMEKNFAFYMWHAMKMQSYFAAAAAAAAGILFHRQIIWKKPRFVFGRGQYHWKHELCLMGWLKGNECPFYGERNQDTVWEIGRENDKIHPTQKPVEIYLKPISNHTKPSEILYEPFSGSGTAFIACEKSSRRCFGLEIDPIYCDVIVDRWQKFTGKKAELISAAP